METGITRELFEGLVKVRKLYWVFTRKEDGSPNLRRFTEKEKEGIVSVKVIQGKWSRACLFTLKTNETFVITIEKGSLINYPEVFQVGKEVNINDLLYGVKEYIGPESGDLKQGDLTPRVVYEKAESEAQEVTNYDNPFGLL